MVDYHPPTVTIHKIEDDRIRREFKELLPGYDLSTGPLKLIISEYQTSEPMTMINEKVLNIRAQVHNEFVEKAQKFVEKYKIGEHDPNLPGLGCIFYRYSNAAELVEFVDPATGKPGSIPSSTTFTDTNEILRKFGYGIEEFGCCKALKHSEWDFRIIACFIIIKGEIDIDLSVLQ